MTHRVNGELLADATTRLLAKERRDRLRAAKLCINGEKHGPATHGVRCKRCAIVHGWNEVRSRKQIATRVRHGESWTPTWRSWNSAIQRCTIPTRQHWADYGGRGITICDRWLDFLSFLADMGERPDGTSLDRIDVNGNYEPGNCRWATAIEQARNTRKTKMRDGDRTRARAMKASGVSYAEIAAVFGVDDSHVSRVTSGVVLMRSFCRNGHEMTTRNSYSFTRGSGRRCTVCRVCLLARRASSADAQQAYRRRPDVRERKNRAKRDARKRRNATHRGVDVEQVQA